MEIFEDASLYLDRRLVLVCQVEHEVEEVTLSHVVRRLLLKHSRRDCVEGPV